MSARAEIDLVRHRLADPARVVKLLGLEDGARREGSGMKIRCPSPNHGDRSPSCSVRVAPDGTISCKCFGCDWTGDLLGLVAVVERLDLERDFRRVLERAAKLASVQLEESHARPIAPSSAPETDRVRAGVQAVAAVLAALGRLDGSRPVADVERYLAGRSLLEEARHAGVFGLASGEAQAAWLRVLRDVASDELAASGLARDGGLAWPAHRLVLPWRAPDGAIDVIQRRALVGYPDRKYVFPRGVAPRWPFGVESLGAALPDAPITFCEGALDVLALRQLYRREGVDRIPLGLAGLEGWRPAFADLARGRVVFVAFDADSQGDAKVQSVADDLRAAGARDVVRSRPVGAKDWAELLAKGCA